VDAEVRPWCRDMHTTTELTSFKGGSMAPGSVSLLAPDYWLAAQADKDAMHFYTWHKVRRPVRPTAVGFSFACLTSRLRHSQEQVSL
jgi:hypothetical protein